MYVAKETFVKQIEQNDDIKTNLEDLNKVCLWYTQEERNWLLNNFWNYALVSEATIILIGLICVSVVGATSCYAFQRTKIFKVFSFAFGCCAIVNALPLGLQYTSDFCTKEEGICNPSGNFCVSTCSWGSGSWQTLATSFLWLSTSFTTWLIRPYRKKFDDDGSKLESDDLSFETDDSAENEMDEENFR